ncbi:MAG: glycine oxidase ThiO [Parvularculaceae bacterium]
MKRPDILVVGGGVIGLMTAWRLSKRGAAVMLVDSRGPASTEAAAGMLAPSFEHALEQGGEALSAFSRESLQLWRSFAREIEDESSAGIDFDEGGILSVAFSDAENAAFVEEADGGEALTRAEALSLEPSLSKEIVAARFARHDAQVDPSAVRRALALALQSCGGAVRRGAQVSEILSDGRSAKGVRLSTGETIGAGAVILATGARIGGLARLPEGALFPVKGEAVSLVRIAGAPSRVIRSRRAYLCPKKNGRVIIGATEIPRDWSVTTDDGRIDALKEGAVQTAPVLQSAEELGRWAGLRPATKDGVPIIGGAPDAENLFYALGHYRNGVLLAPATAEALARLILDGAHDPALAAFSAGRF